jgi:hypothetical protein
MSEYSKHWLHIEYLQQFLESRKEGPSIRVELG